MGDSTASGRFVLRLSPGLHVSLRRAAAEHGVSLNEYCATKLAAPVGDLCAFGGAPNAVRRAADLVGESLIGVVAFGSWARGELADTSEIDALIVTGRDTVITRDLYRRWDEEPVVWKSHTIEPHFTHLPSENVLPSGLWAEVATDGVVLFARDLRLSLALASVRRTLSEGLLVRRTAHGQQYWVKTS